MGVLAVITPIILWIFYPIHPRPVLSGDEKRKGITIKYPLKDWEPVIPGDFDGEVIRFILKNQKQADSCTVEIAISIKNLPPRLLSLEESKNLALKTIERINPNQQITDETKPSTTLSSFNAYKLTYTRQEIQCKQQVLEVGTVRNGKLYFVTYTAELAKYSQYLSTAEAMIQSFKINEAGKSYSFE
ncbi:hypothetical protein HCG51_22860 [Tolypothrix sp. PCC 7910]|uniref:hypothetical protein n=1 Tax=Tolypothrix sp. PCC 7910 TaxID=2099387 RepID=UPI001427909E|nr:hypothetical protein [Tolypothrix sp. PCC 7910]QIR39269.1 hypothetical protein HCG51_22860 [Tolypothrix sp. PCC 7910]